MANLFRRRYQENTILLKFCKFVADILMIMVFAYVIIHFLCARTVVTGSSMDQTIQNEDMVLINKMSYAFMSPKRYDIIAFNANSTSTKIFVKRVIGLPGDKVIIKDNKIYINGNPLEGDVSDEAILTAGLASNEIQLGSGEYFVLGDNRNNSEDSRFASIGKVKKNNIQGKVWGIMSPVKHFKIFV